MTSIQSFYDYVILRDILAFILPGSISLGGIFMIIRAFGIERLEKTLPFLFNLNVYVQVVLFVLISFLVGHVWDMVYRLLIQKVKLRGKYIKFDFERTEIIKKMLGDPALDSKSVSNHIAREIRSSLGEFLNINWIDEPIEQWVASGKAYEASLLTSYWIEEEDPRLFSAEVGRPIIQAHFLIVCGLAFVFAGAICVPIVGIIHTVGVNPSMDFDLYSYLMLAIGSLLFGLLLVLQGIHKRDIIVEHAFRVFHVVWRKRALERDANLLIAQHGRNTKKSSRSEKVKS
jgi:hypothetical protein